VVDELCKNQPGKSSRKGRRENSWILCVLVSTDQVGTPQSQLTHAPPIHKL